MSCSSTVPEPSPALDAFVARLFDLARTLDILAQAPRLGDAPLAAATNLLLRAQLRRLRYAHAQLAPRDHAEANRLLDGLQQRLSVLAERPRLAGSLQLLRRFTCP